MTTDKVLFINDLVLISERAAGDAAAPLYHIEVETRSGRQALSLTPDVAQVLLSGLVHVLKRDD